MKIASYLKKLTKPQAQKSRSALDIPLYSSFEEAPASIESYKNNSVVHRCVSLIATSASHIPWHVYKNNGQHRKLIPDHPAAKLLKRPHPEQSGADFFAENIANLLLYGNSYILTNNNPHPSELYNLSPINVEHVVSGGKLVAYKHQNRTFPIDPITRTSHVLCFKNYSPSSGQKGLSALSAASKAIHLHSKIMDWNKSLLKNSTRPSGALVFQDGNGYLTDEQFERLQQQFYENFSGASNSGKPLILEGGLKWQETHNAERFEKFIELKDSSTRDIAVAFNIPPQLLGLNGDSTYSNMQEARMALWEENIIPLLDKYSDALSAWLSNWYNEDLIIDFDREAISVLTERRENLWAKIAGANFMTINEKRSLIGLEPIEGGDTLIS